ncbi:MAG: segregation/condensation protein A, partial [Lachnospiraceae bacterium]|nr:segregation/condensation protein A [Lachnospiraceae bacterium]
SFREILLRQKSKVQTIVVFLAMLELMKYGIIEASQDSANDEIWIEAVPGADISTVNIEADFDEM